VAEYQGGVVVVLEDLDKVPYQMHVEREDRQ